MAKEFKITALRLAELEKKKAAAAELPADDLTDTQSGGLPAGAEQLQTITTQSSSTQTAGQLYPAAPLPESWKR